MASATGLGAYCVLPAALQTISHKGVAALAQGAMPLASSTPSHAASTERISAGVRTWREKRRRRRRGDMARL